MNSQKFANDVIFSQSGEISPTLVTLEERDFQQLKLILV